MYALVDCNNFYVSCERLYRPDLNDKPVVVLSNNDGCIISRSNEAKALGIKMGAPFFQVQDIIQKHQIQVFSSNYTLYADMSARVMNNLARFTPDVEVYSIDECFLGLSGIESLAAYAERVRSRIIQHTAIPISVGIAPTKTLAKLANKLAKKSSIGIYILNSEEAVREAVNNFPIGDIWGIGRAYQKKLELEGIYTAGQLMDKHPEWIKNRFTIQGLRLWHELHGRSCIPLDQVMERKKIICSSRSFGKPCKELEQLLEAGASYTSRLAEKLRADNSCATLVTVQLMTSRFRTDTPGYFNSVTVPLSHPCNNTPDLVKTVLEALKMIYKPGYLYSKVAVLASGLIPKAEVQLNLFTKWDNGARDKVSKVLDKLNNYYGRGTVRMASEGFQKNWSMKQQYLSPAYTTSWEDIPRVG